MKRARLPSLKVYRDERREWRWRLLATNNRIIADSGEGYKTATGAWKAARRVGAAVTLALESLDAAT